MHVHFDLTTKVKTWEMSLNTITIKKNGSTEELSSNNKRKLYLLNYNSDIVAELPMKDFSNESLLKDIRLDRILKYRDSDVIIGYDSDVKYRYSALLYLWVGGEAMS